MKVKAMKTIELTYPHILKEQDLPESVCALGFFDGIHQGHQKVIRTAVAEAKRRNMASAVITFHPHPSVVLRKNGNKDVQYITPLKEKEEILRRMDVDRLYIITFNMELAGLSPQDFIDHFVVGLHIKHVVAGFDFTYGHKGQGNMTEIGKHAQGRFTYSVIDKVELENEKISSTRIRGLLQEGDVAEVKRLLGRPLTISGDVVEGAKRGRVLGYPTANLDVNEAALLPRSGIYAVKVIYKQQIYEGMASLGTNPTFTEDRLDLSLEVHILDYNNDLYGEELQLEWHDFIRPEEKFNQVEELIRQIEDDERKIRALFAKLK